MKKLPVLNNTIEELTFKSIKDIRKTIYFDNNATTKTDEDAINAMFRVLELDYSNPSGIHKEAYKARDLIEASRKDVADFIGCQSNEVIFSSGGTESINSAINAAIKLNKSKNIITCETEHSATKNKLEELKKEGYHIYYLPIDQDGHFNVDDFNYFFFNVFKKSVSLFTIMGANNETGTIHNVENLKYIFKVIKEYGGYNHLDAIQLAGKSDIKNYITIPELDFLSISGHKFHAPKGIGALFVRSGIDFAPLLFGGKQEDGRRAGTENVAGIIGLGEVCRKNTPFVPMTNDNRELFIKLLTAAIPDAIINGGGMVNTINVGFPYINREAMVVLMGEAGLMAGIGSACSTGIEPSFVLKAMGVDKKYIHGSVRFSFGKYNTKEEIEQSIEIIKSVYDKLKGITI